MLRIMVPDKPPVLTFKLKGEVEAVVRELKEC
jgi:hypothetical protein